MFRRNPEEKKPETPIEISAIVSSMTPEQKVAQMVLASEALKPQNLEAKHPPLGGVLAEGNTTMGTEGTPSFNSLVEWKKFTLGLRKKALEQATESGSKYVLLPELEMDAITGDQHVDH